MTKVMLATLIREPFDSPEWIFETKWDGYRALARKAKRVKMVTRNGKSLNTRFPTIVKALEGLRGSYVLDGEIVILDKQGRSHFQLLQNYQKSQEGTPYYYLFDLLAYNGKSLAHLPLITRKRMLKELLRSSRSRSLRFSNHIAGKGKALFRKAKAKKWEGIIAKKADSSYQFRRPSSSITWVQPNLVCEVSFAEWTRDGKLRQPIFEGLRIDKSPKEVVREHA